MLALWYSPTIFTTRLESVQISRINNSSSPVVSFHYLFLLIEEWFFFMDYHSYHLSLIVKQELVHGCIQFPLLPISTGCTFIDIAPYFDPFETLNYVLLYINFHFPVNSTNWINVLQTWCVKGHWGQMLNPRHECHQH